jgi:hypothetical protein
MHSSDFILRRLFFKHRKCRSLPKPKRMTCSQGNPISYANKRLIRFVLQWNPLCMGPKWFQQQIAHTFRYAGTEPDKQQPLRPMPIVGRQLSNLSPKSIRLHLLNASIAINHVNIMSAKNCQKSRL